MVYSHIGRLTQWKGYSKNLDTAIGWLLSVPFREMTAGKYTIDGEQVFALVQEKRTAPRGQLKWEAHREYIDLQLLLEGKESIGFQEAAGLRPAGDWETENDIGFYLDNGLGFFVPMKPRDFVLCFPEDAHMPLVAEKEPEELRKLVIKFKCGTGGRQI